MRSGVEALPTFVGICGQRYKYDESRPTPKNLLLKQTIILLWGYTNIKPTYHAVS